MRGRLYGPVLMLFGLFRLIKVLQIEEVCIGETFKAECNSSISIDSALFGRMKESRCTVNRSSSLGCSVDVRPTVGGQCDGRRECSITLVSVDQFDDSSCDRRLPPYLEVRYTCTDANNVHNVYSNESESNTSPFHDRLFYALIGPVAVIFISMAALVWLLLRFRSRRIRLKESENETDCVGNSVAIASNLHQSDNCIFQNDFYNACTDSYEKYGDQKKFSVEDDTYDEIRDTEP